MTSLDVLSNRRIVIGVGGGIAAFKAVILVREMLRRGGEARVVMTSSATRFVGPMTFSGLTGHPAVTDLWDPSYAGEAHVELARWADAVVVAPATMNLLARAAAGMADDALLATVACMAGPVVWAPAMHARMWEQPATRRNVERLEADGHHIVRPTVGALASGEVGAGRMAEPDVIVAALERLLGGEVRRDLAGRRIVVTAGPTAEDLDPVRFFTNRSSGRMGYALAERAAARGATVTLVSGPVTLSTPPDVHRVDVRSARDMQRAVATAAEGADVVIMAAAVADYRPAEESEHKLRKSEGPLTLELARNPDILADLGANRHGPTPMLIGFAVETQDLIQRARDKLSRKGADLIVANAASIGFGGEDNDAVLVDAEGEDAVGAMSKRELADRILDRVVRARPAAGA